MGRAIRRVLGVGLSLALAGCSGVQSALAPAGRAAGRLADLFWWMSAGLVLIWAAVAWLAFSAMHGRAARQTERQARLYIIGGGALFPTVVLAGLLAYGLHLMPPLLATAPAGSLRIVVTGEQWWWRIRYEPADGAPFELANEIRLPVGAPVEFTVESPDVIHSFWIPPLGGKIDLIPGRRNRLVLEPTRTGTFRGVCAEYCGTAHALMAFYVVVLTRAEFETWVEHQRRPAADPGDARAAQGRELFFTVGCSACHAIAGTDARGFVGPNLTHVGSRLTLGAGIVENGPDGFARWLERTNLVKPGVHMPHFGMLPREELAALAAYLESLQ